MFKKILIPTDGSELSNATALIGVQFAQQIQAEIVGLFVAPPFEQPKYVDITATGYPTKDEYEAFLRNAGNDYLDQIKQAAQQAGVKFSGDMTFSSAVAHEIVQAAQAGGCDLIFMGSHGRSGWGQAILGSVTNKVLSTCDIPVLVHRIKTAGSQR
jgi:nucleotide-binding universal stress UspA family protein